MPRVHILFAAAAAATLADFDGKIERRFQCRFTDPTDPIGRFLDPKTQRLMDQRPALGRVADLIRDGWISTDNPIQLDRLQRLYCEVVTCDPAYLALEMKRLENFIYEAQVRAPMAVAA